ncbi:sugar ABC transporter substrate-binding protein [Candidatus Bipolaricaulota bacterium]|nr:sugar ABC transporter substrate-binding protein [Candidatus Bipolaricaulota bacterium]
MLRAGRVCVAVFAALLILPALSFAGGEAEKAGGEGPTKILFIPFTMEHVFQKELCDGAKIPIPGFDLEVIVEDPYGKIEREMEILETYMTQGIDGVVMYPIDSKALVPVVREMKEKGIWIFTTGNHVEGEDLGMGTDERDGGLLAADMFIRWWNENRPGQTAHILLLDIPQVPEPQRKMIAFEEVVSAKMPNATFFHVDSNGSTEPALVGTEQYLQSHPEINFIFGINASATLGGIAACENAGRLDIAHASCGAEPPILALLKKPLSPQGGGVVWDIGYGKSAVQYGNHLVEVAAKAIKAGSTDGLKIDIGFQEVWRDNVDEVVAVMQEWRKKANLEPMDF